MNYIPPSSNHRTRLQDGGRIVIPAEYRKALNLAVGEDIIIRLKGDEIHIYSAKQALERARRFVKKHAPGKNVVDELIAERRREARREWEE